MGIIRAVMVVVVLVGFAARARAGVGAAVDFDREVRPILSNNCFDCHGPDEKARKGKLRLDTREGAIAKAGDEALIVPGSRATSELYKRISSDDGDEVMPPPRHNKKLTKEQIELIGTWIDEGAKWQSHWAFEAPRKAGLPAVKNEKWVRNPVDRFVLARLEKAGLAPNAEADRYTLIRRLSLDLTGLPPSIQDVDAFVKDPSPDAYEKLVERILASPHFGEKMAQGWLDLSRFGDTNGFHYDSTRQMWLWRNYVIDSFNKNKPYDQFVVEQLAGDMIENATVEQRVASGFNRNTRFNEEGGADPKEFSVRYAVDRTNTLGTVFMGVTLECAECHTHKYDPISHKEYYQLYAFFNSLEDPQTSGNHNQPLPPLLKVPTAEQESALAKAKAELADVEKQITELLAKVDYVDPAGEKAEAPRQADYVWIDDETPAKANLTQPWAWASAPSVPVLSGQRAVRVGGSGVQQFFFQDGPMPLIVHPGDKLFAFVWLDPKAPPTTVALQFFSNGNWEHRALWGKDEKWPWGAPNSPGRKVVGALPETGKWVRLEVDAAAVGLKPGDAITGWAFTQMEGTAVFDRAGVYTAFAPDGAHLSSQVAWEEKARALGFKDVPKDVRDAIKAERGKRNDVQKKVIREHYLRNHYAGTKQTIGPVQDKADAIARQVKTIEDAIPTTMVSAEMKERRKAHVLIRGDFTTPGEEVQAEVPAMFPPMLSDMPKTRLTLAQWLVDGKHPTVARVQVNRLWAGVFGTGLFKTMGDVGMQGERPSHPELLDYLAVEFVDKGWDIKAMIRLMVTSSTYRQSSKYDAAKAAVDGDNRLLWRSPRYRLSAEEVRDNALAIAGHLTRKVGGPSVNPYQPAGYYNGKYGWQWNQSKGEDLYRRGMYTFWRRTALHPTMQMFDAPSREVCTASRARINTPLQALAMMNDPTFVEAARVLAERAIKEGGDTVEKRLEFAFRRALARPPAAAELAVLKETLEKQKEIFAKDAKKAEGLLKVGEFPIGKDVDQVELATWTAVCGVILNLDEVVNRE